MNFVFSNFQTSKKKQKNFFPFISPFTKTYEERMSIQIEAQSAYFAGIIIMQWMDVIVCKTRRVSIFRHGMR